MIQEPKGIRTDLIVPANAGACANLVSRIIGGQAFLRRVPGEVAFDDKILYRIPMKT
jgi:hypothetical protein